MAAGDFSASSMPNVLIGIEEVFKGARHSQGIKKPVDAANAILSRQQVAWDVVYSQTGMNNAQKCVGANVVWLKDCNDTVSDCSIADCDLDGPEMESDSQLYQPNLCGEISKKVKGAACKDYFEQERKIGMAIANMTLALDQEIQNVLEAFIIANPQANRYTNTYGTIRTVPVDFTTFTEEEWGTAKIIAELVKTAELNDMNDVFAISGNLLYDSWFLSRFNECCDSDKNVFASNVLDMFWDLRNFDALNGGDQTLALVDSGAYGFFGVNAYTNSVPTPFARGGDLFVWSQPSSRLMWNNNGTLTPVMYDFELQEKCVVSGNIRYIDTVIRATYRAGLALAPPTCNADDTGILLFGVDEEYDATWGSTPESGEGEGGEGEA